MDTIKQIANETNIHLKQIIIDNVGTKASAFATEIERDGDASEEFARTLLSSAIPTSSERDEEREHEPEDFPLLPEAASSALFCARLVLEQSSTLRNNQKCVIPLAVMCYAHLDQTLPWCSETSVKNSNELLKLLRGEESPAVFAVNIINDIQTHLRKDTWKKNPCYRHIYKAALLDIRLPYLFDHINLVLPHALLLVDDYMMYNQVLGLTCVKHIIKNVTPTELHWQKRDEVLYDALKHLFYVREAPVIDSLYDCLHQFLFSSDNEICSLLRVQDEHGLYCRSEEVFREMLRGAEVEQKIIIREAYSRHLTPFILSMGTRVLKFIQRTLRIVLDYIDVYDTPKQTCRLHALRALEAVVKVAWPVMPSRFDEVVKALFRLAYDLDERQCDEMNDRLRCCLMLLGDACPKEHANFVKELHSLKEKGIPGINRLLSCAS